MRTIRALAALLLAAVFLVGSIGAATAYAPPPIDYPEYPPVVVEDPPDPPDGYADPPGLFPPRPPILTETGAMALQTGLSGLAFAMSGLALLMNVRRDRQPVPVVASPVYEWPPPTPAQPVTRRQARLADSSARTGGGSRRRHRR